MNGMNLEVPCPICQCPSHRMYARVKNTHPGTGEFFDIVQCDECSARYVDPRPDPRTLAELHEGRFSAPVHDKAGRFKRLTTSRPRLRRIYHAYTGYFLGYVLGQVSGRVLDIGCGYGDLMQDLKAAGCDAYGVEPSLEAVERCRQAGLKVERSCFEKTAFADGYFDAVTLWHVVEHLPSPVEAFKEIRRVLKPGGRVYVTCPNSDAWQAILFGGNWCGWDAPFHLIHFKPGDMPGLAERTGFSLIVNKSMTPDYMLAQSFASLAGGKGGLYRAVLRNRVLSSLPLRLVLSPGFRFLDLLMPKRGECLCVVMEKSGAAGF